MYFPFGKLFCCVFSGAFAVRRINQECQVCTRKNLVATFWFAKSPVWDRGFFKSSVFRSRNVYEQTPIIGNGHTFNGESCDFRLMTIEFRPCSCTNFTIIYISTVMIFYTPTARICTISLRVGGFNPSENYSSNWIISPSKGENKQ